MRILKSQLYELELRKQREEQAKIEGEKKKIEWGSTDKILCASSI